MTPISVIIPTFNAAITLDKPIDGLQAQSYKDWDAIIVDDGSKDGTVRMAKNWAQNEPHLRLIEQTHKGASAARNFEIAAAHQDWLLFLDADDWLDPQHLARLVRAIRNDPGLDAVFCRSKGILPFGETGTPHKVASPEDLFSAAADYCPIAIHSCLVKSAYVTALGGFDENLTTCEDWDLWQRIARSRAKMGKINNTLAFYQIRSDSTSAENLLQDGYSVIQCGHQTDDRVEHPRQELVDGLPAGRLSESKYYLLGWCAGILLGQERDPCDLFETLDLGQKARVNPKKIASALFTIFAIGTRSAGKSSHPLWSEGHEQVSNFLRSIEEKTAVLELEIDARREFQRLALRSANSKKQLAKKEFVLALKLSMQIASYLFSWKTWRFGLQLATMSPRPDHAQRAERHLVPRRNGCSRHFFDWAEAHLDANELSLARACCRPIAEALKRELEDVFVGLPVWSVRDRIRDSVLYRSSVARLPGRVRRATRAALSELRRSDPAGVTKRGPVVTAERVALHTCQVRLPIDRARRELGYDPVVPFQEACRRAVAWLAFAGYPVTDEARGATS